MVVDMQSGTIAYYDSLQGTRRGYKYVLGVISRLIRTNTPHGRSDCCQIREGNATLPTRRDEG